jgi:hypothetical protein
MMSRNNDFLNPRAGSSPRVFLICSLAAVVTQVDMALKMGLYKWQIVV